MEHGSDVRESIQGSGSWEVWIGEPQQKLVRATTDRDEGAAWDLFMDMVRGFIDDSGRGYVELRNPHGVVTARCTVQATDAPAG